MTETGVGNEFKRLCATLKGPEAEKSAAELEHLLQKGVPDVRDVNEAAKDLISGFKECESKEVVAILARCLSALINAPGGQGSALCTEELFRDAAEKLRKFENAPESFFTNYLSLCELLSSRVSLSSSPDPTAWAFCSTFCKLETQERAVIRGFHNQRLSLRVLKNLIEKPQGKENLRDFIWDIAKFMTHYDEEVAAEAISAFVELAEIVSDQDLPGVLEKVTVALLVVTRGPSVLKLLSVLDFVAQKPNGLALLFEHCFKKGSESVRIDLELVCDMYDEVGESRDNLYKVVLQLVSKMCEERGQETSQVKEQQKEFAREVGPLIVTLFTSGVRDLELCTDVLLAILKYATPPNIEDVFYCLGSLVNGPLVTLVEPLVKAIKDVGNIRGYVFEAKEIIELLKSDTTEAAKSICATLQYQTDGKEETDSRELKLQTEIKTDRDRDRVVKANANELIRVGPAHARGALNEAVLKILDGYGDTPVPENVVDVLLGLFEGICLPMMFSSAVRWRDSGSSDFKLFMTQTLALDVTVGDAVHRVEFPLSSDFLAVEMWYNEKFCNVDGTKLVEAAQRNPKLSQVIQRSDIESAQGSKAALLHRAYKTPGYKRAKFIVSETSFCAYDGLCQAFEHKKTYPYTLEPMAVTLVELPEDAHDERFNEYAQADTEAFNNASLPFALLRHILRARPSTNSTVFRQLIMNHIKFAYLDMDRTDIFWSIVRSYQDLIPQDIAPLLARSTSFDVRHNIQHMCGTFETDLSRDIYDVFPGTEPFRCRVRRDSIWEDGLAVIEHLGPGDIDLEIEFVDENGTGKCTVTEFFDSLAQEMYKTSLKLWIVDQNENEFVSVPDNGLYPRPDADPHLIYILGLAVAKAASMGCVFPIQLHPAVFEIAQCNSPSDIRKSIYEEITEEASVVSGEDNEGVYGLVFEFPGLGIPLKEGGEDICVDDENAEEFKSLFKEKVVSFDLIREFARGFTKVLPLSALTAFSAKDLPTLFTGKIQELTERDLQNHVVLDGYSPGDIQIKYLFEGLQEMTSGDVSLFLQFITGCKFLPVDGLGGLSPKLTIRRWEVPDEFRRLPTAITCENVLKLPPYTSKSVLTEKLRVAIHEGREEFLGQ